MDMVIAAVALVAGTTLAGRVLSWFVARGYSAYASLVHGRDDAAFYGSQMPWPSGVQEDDEVHWRIPSGGRTRPAAAVEELEPNATAATPVHSRTRRR